MPKNDQNDQNDQSEEKRDNIRQNQLDIRKELIELKKDVNNVSDTVKNDKGNAKRTLKYTIKKRRVEIALTIGIGIVIWFAFGPDNFTIPDSVYVVLIGMGLGAIFGYPIAKRIAEMFVVDNRVPIFATKPEDTTDLAIYRVPNERIVEMPVVGGEKKEWTTIQGIGYEVERLEIEESEGKQHITAKAAWIGEKTGMQLKKKEAEIKGMRESLTPLAKKGMAYEVMFPSIIYELQSEAANMLTEEFQNIASHNGEKLKDRIENRMNDFHPDVIDEKVDKEDMTNGNLQEIANDD
jgi:hypothetical protein